EVCYRAIASLIRAGGLMMFRKRRWIGRPKERSAQNSLSPERSLPKLETSDRPCPAAAYRAKLGRMPRLYFIVFALLLPTETLEATTDGQGRSGYLLVPGETASCVSNVSWSSVTCTATWTRDLAGYVTWTGRPTVCNCAFDGKATEYTCPSNTIPINTSGNHY